MIDTKEQAVTTVVPQQQPSKKIVGIVIGVLAGLDDSGEPLVIFPGNERDTDLKARSSAVLSREDEGREVAIMFENGQLDRPLIIIRGAYVLSRSSGANRIKGGSVQIN